MKLTEKNLRQRKNSNQIITMLTSYDYPTAIMEDACEIDVQLVGDSVGTNMLGYDDVSQVTMDDMVHHVKAVSRGAKKSFVLCDMPYKSFDTVELAVSNAQRLMDSGANGVKIEGENDVIDKISAVTNAGIPVCAHVGYTPQTDGTKATVQGKDIGRALELLDVAKKVENAGAFMVVLELIPERLAKIITESVAIPTIGIGAGRYCDGQVQVILDILGISDKIFRHAKLFENVGELQKTAIKSYSSDVRNKLFPQEKNTSRLSDDVFEELLAIIKGDIG